MQVNSLSQDWLDYIKTMPVQTVDTATTATLTTNGANGWATTTATPYTVNSTTTTNPWTYSYNYDIWDQLNNNIAHNTEKFDYGNIGVITKQRYFKGMPMNKYVITLVGYFPKDEHIKKGWPLVIGPYKDWIMIENVLDYNTQVIEVVTPLHIKLQKGMFVAPLNQYDRGVENKEIIDFINSQNVACL